MYGFMVYEVLSCTSNWSLTTNKFKGSHILDLWNSHLDLGIKAWGPQFYIKTKYPPTQIWHNLFYLDYS